MSTVDNPNQLSPNNPVFANAYFDGTYDPTEGTVYRTGDILSNLLDDYTGEEVQFKKVEDATGVVVDGIIFRELTTVENGNEIFQRIIEDGIVNIAWFGAKCDYRTGLFTDNATAIKNAINFMQTISAALDRSRAVSYTLYFPASDEGLGYASSEDLDFGGDYNVSMSAPLYRSGVLPTTGGAFVIIGSSSENSRLNSFNKEQRIWVRCVVTEWKGIEYAGVEIMNHVRSRIEVVESWNFEIGVRFVGRQAGFSYNNAIRVGNILNARIGLDINAFGSGNQQGYVTSCSFNIGRIGQNSNTNSLAFNFERVGIRLNGEDYPCESLTFFDGVIEGLIPADNPNNFIGIPVQVIRGSLNKFENFRHENNGNVFLRVEQGANYSNVATLTYCNNPYLTVKELLEDASRQPGNSVATRYGEYMLAEIGRGRTIYSTGNLASRAVIYSETGALHIRGLERILAGDAGTPVPAIPNALLTTDGYIQLSGQGANISFVLDTTSIKRMIIMPYWAEEMKGRIYYQLFDEVGNRITDLSPNIWGGGGMRYTTTLYGAAAQQFYSAYERPYDYAISVSSLVKSLRVIVSTEQVSDTTNYGLKIRGLDVLSQDGRGASGAWNSRKIDHHLTTQAPEEGTYGKGQILYNDNFQSSPNTLGWICTEGGTPGVWAEIPLSKFTLSYRRQINGEEDLNNFMDTGIYYRDTAVTVLNAPTQFYGILEVVANPEKTRIYQRWTSSSGGAGALAGMFIRNYANNVWTSWTRTNAKNVGTLTENTILTHLNDVVLVDTSTAAIQITLPNAVGSGKELTVKKISSDANIVTIITISGQTIDGSGTSRTIASPNALLRLISNGQGWYIV